MNNQIWLSCLHSVIHICLDNKFEQIRIPKCYNLPFNCMEKLFCFLQKQLFAVKEYLKTVNVWKRFFEYMSLICTCSKLSPGSFCLFLNFEYLKIVMVCFLYLLVEKLCHKEAHFPSTTHLSHAGQVVFLYFSLQVGYFSCIFPVFQPPGCLFFNLTHVFSSSLPVF